MSFEVSQPAPREIAEVVERLAQWQRTNVPFSLHPGDVGWFQRFGAVKTAEALRVWRSRGEIVAVGLLDGADLLRVAIAPTHLADGELAAQIAAAASDPRHGVLPAGDVFVEVPPGAALDGALADAGWETGEPWTLLQTSLETASADGGTLVATESPSGADADSVASDGVTSDSVASGAVASGGVTPDSAESDGVASGGAVVVDATSDEGLAAEWCDVIRASFRNSTFDLDNWRSMSNGPAYADAQLLLLRDPDGAPAAGIAVWSAGKGRSGLIEPMGVHPDYQGRGYGVAITRAGVEALRQGGAASALVGTPSGNVPAVASYLSAGFTALPERLDRQRTNR